MVKVDTNPTNQSRWEGIVNKAADQAQKSGVKGFFEGLKEKVTGAPTKSQAEVTATSDRFLTAFNEKLQNLGHELGLDPTEFQKLQQQGRASLSDIVHSTFDYAQNTGSGTMTKESLGLAVLTANTAATRTIIELRNEFGESTRPPQITPFRDSEGNIKFNVTKTAPQLESLILRGGGAKGVGNAPALVEMEKTGALAGLKQVVGTSAGALTAVGLASGLSAQEFQKLSDGTDFNGLKKKPEGFSTQYPDTMVKFGSTGFHAGTALQTLDRVSAGSVKGFLDSSWGKVTTALAKGDITDSEVARLTQLKDQNFETDRTGQMVTFRDLDILSRVDSTKFKQLTLTAWNDTDKSLKYFDVKSNPYMPIAIAGRMSMSIPVYFASVQYSVGDGVKTWTDGGVGSNMPAGAIFDRLEAAVTAAKDDLEKAKLTLFRSQTPENATLTQQAQGKLDKALDDLSQARQRTFLMTFDDEGAAYKKIYGRTKESTQKTSFVGVLAGNKNMPQVRAEDNRQVREGGINTMVVFHGKMGTLSLDATPSEKAFASLTARMRALEHIEQRQNQPTYDVFGDATRAASSLSPSERAEVLQSPPPNRNDYADDALYRAASEFYQQVQTLQGGGQPGAQGLRA